ncbi:MAG TPA: peptidoglycan DD-metalloendopeptidase family protein [Mycobacteriales bacterium]|nr:peptidoglycan DD-metalloendopeptidase family protein [Mycobacteriales bacterium]
MISLALLTTGFGTASTGHAETLGSVRQEAERLRVQIAALRVETGRTITRLEAAETALGQAVGQAISAGAALDRARATSRGSDQRAKRRVAAIYRSGGSVGLWATLLKARDPQDLVSRYSNMRAVLTSDQKLVAGDAGLTLKLSAVEQTARRTAGERTRAAAAVEAEEARLSALIAEQRAKLDDADAKVRAALAEAQRRAAEEATRRLAAQAQALALTAASAPYVSGAGACPVGPVHSFVDTWLAPRSGGRQHQGTDVFAPYGAPAFAVVDGTIERWASGGLGGIALYLAADNGDRFYYAHNASNVAVPGQRVRAGELIAYVGTTGNAETTPPHIHFEAHPGGGPAVNPAPWLAALCGH